MDWKIELIAVPVTDVDRARDFWANIGWHVDHDQTVSEDIRFVQGRHRLGRRVTPRRSQTLTQVERRTRRGDGP